MKNHYSTISHLKCPLAIISFILLFLICDCVALVDPIPGQIWCTAKVQDDWGKVTFSVKPEYNYIFDSTWQLHMHDDSMGIKKFIKGKISANGKILEFIDVDLRPSKYPLCTPERLSVKKKKYEKGIHGINPIITATLKTKTDIRFIKLADKSDCYPDGYIGKFQQKSVGDCWFLSSIMASNNNVNGRNFFKTAITKKNATTWHVCTNVYQGDVTQSELDHYTIDGKQLSKGDADVRALEIAADKYHAVNDIESHTPVKGFYLLNGKLNLQTTLGVIKKNIKRRLERDYNKTKNEGCAWAFRSVAFKENPMGYPPNHDGAIMSIDFSNNRFTYQNPWNAGVNVNDNLDKLIDSIKSQQIRIIYGKW